jgi:hypothetical protein
MATLLARLEPQKEFAADGFTITVLSPPDESDDGSSTDSILRVLHLGSVVTMRTKSENRWVTVLAELWDGEPPMDTRERWEASGELDFEWHHQTVVIGRSPNVDDDNPNFFPLSPGASRVRVHRVGEEGEERVLVQIWSQHP